MTEDRYPQLLRTPTARWWRPLVGLLLAGLVLGVGSVAVILATLVAAAMGGAEDPFSDATLKAGRPLGLLANNLVLGLLIPASVLAVLAVHRVSPGWLASVAGRPRWGLLLRWLGTAAVVVVAAFAASFLLPTEAGDGGGAGAARGGALAGLLAVILLTTPLQAAAEEVGFRGYLSQAVAAWVPRPVAGAVLAAAVSATLFALAHGSQDVWLFGDRLAFGLVASWLAWRTGGLEAPIALHVANNLVSLVYTALTGSLEEALTASTLSWPFAVLDVAMMAAFALSAHLLATRWHVVARRSAPPAALSGPGEVGYPGPATSTPPPAGDEHPWGMG